MGVLAPHDRAFSPALVSSSAFLLTLLPALFLKALLPARLRKAIIHTYQVSDSDPYQVSDYERLELRLPPNLQNWSSISRPEAPGQHALTEE